MDGTSSPAATFPGRRDGATSGRYKVEEGKKKMPMETRRINLRPRIGASGVWKRVYKY